MIKTVTIVNVVRAINIRLERDKKITIADYNLMLRGLMGENYLRKLNFTLFHIGKKPIRDYRLPVDLVIVTLLRFERLTIVRVLKDLGVNVDDYQDYLIKKYVNSYKLTNDATRNYKELLKNSIDDGYLDNYELFMLTGVNRDVIESLLVSLGLMKVTNEGIKRRFTNYEASPYIAIIKGYQKWSIVILAVICLINTIKSEV
jgi:hypothetical protein